MFDIFTGDSGLKDDWDGTISPQSRFTPNFNADGWQAKFIVLPSDETNEQHFYYGVDKNWQSYDSGMTLQYEGSKTPRFNVNCGYLKWLARAMSIGAEDEITSRMARFGDLGPANIEFWFGMTFHYEVITDENAKSKVGDKFVTTPKDVIVATKFLGTSDLPASPEQIVTEVSLDELAEMSQMAKTLDSYRSWQVALSTKFHGNKAVLSHLGDEKFYSELREG